MPTEAAPTAEVAPLSFQIGLPAEIALVGLSGGLRPEVTWGTSAHRLRLAVGALIGRELTFLPVTVGYRLNLLPQRQIHPQIGLGWEFQTFLIGAEPVTRGGDDGIGAARRSRPALVGGRPPHHRLRSRRRPRVRADGAGGGVVSA